ncbi:MAG: YbaB/EbfC family nucleoid-associated protein, partial [Rhizobiales bacterium]|nr:YbaB/EbfC family nucleoid-associated protein [Hyphomicrobiales bacterium]
MRDILGMMSKAKELQSKMQDMQAEVANIEVEGSSGAGLVKVVMTAKGDLRKLSIDPSLLKPE